MPSENWILRGGRGAAIAKKYDLDPYLARILAVRCKEESVEEYLNREGQLFDPLLMEDMVRAVDLIDDHLSMDKELTIVGDYDVDGLTSTTILLKGLSHLYPGASIHYRIPERISDGYGFSIDIARELEAKGVQMVLTCDNGIREFETGRYLKEQGNLDEILDGLENGGSQYHLTRLKSSDYQDKLQEQKALWADIKNQIISLREDRSEDNGAILLQESEDYYSLCDETVSLAQSYSQSLVRTLNFHEIFIVLDLAIMSVITLHRYWLAAMTFRRNSAMEKQMYDDPLTGIYNRKYYESRIKYSSGITDSSIVYIDLDHLKYINDNYGHNTGDEYLKKAVIHLKNSFRTSDLIIRMGGDEFLVILKGCRLKAAEIIMDKALSSFRQTNDTKYPCSFSYGISYISDDGTKTVPQAIAEADMKMYACKKDHQIIRGE